MIDSEVKPGQMLVAEAKIIVARSKKVKRLASRPGEAKCLVLRLGEAKILA